MSDNKQDTYTCCICHKKFNGYGNDPWPVNMDKDAICCDKCNLTVVVPARIRELTKEVE